MNKPLEEAINYLKGKLIETGEEWNKTKDKNAMRDCLALVDSINALEDRAYGRVITDITYVLK